MPWLRISLPKRTRKAIVALVSVGLLFVLGFSFSALFAPQVPESPLTANQTQAPSFQETSVSPPPSANTDPIDSTAGWEIYTDSVYSYSVKYPSDWFLQPTPKRGTGGSALFTSYDTTEIKGPAVSNILTRDKIKIEIGVSLQPETSGQSLQAWLEQKRQNPSPTRTRVVSESKIKIADQTGVKQLVDKGVSSSIVVYVDHDNKIYYLAATPADSVHLPLFELMLDTFHFQP